MDEQKHDFVSQEIHAVIVILLEKFHAVMFGFRSLNKSMVFRFLTKFGDAHTSEAALPQTIILYCSLLLSYNICNSLLGY